MSEILVKLGFQEIDRREEESVIFSMDALIREVQILRNRVEQGDYTIVSKLEKQLEISSSQHRKDEKALFVKLYIVCNLYLET